MKCDLYFDKAVSTERLKYVQLLDGSFIYDERKSYLGFLLINVERLKLLPVILDMRRLGITCVSIPVKYRDGAKIDADPALKIAEGYAASKNSSIRASLNAGNRSPMFWILDLVSDDPMLENAGGVVMVDKLDGHVWSSLEYEEYMYDFNSIL